MLVSGEIALKSSLAFPHGEPYYGSRIVLRTFSEPLKVPYGNFLGIIGISYLPIWTLQVQDINFG